MSTTITINEDQTLSVTWTGEKGGGSLFQIMATGNAKNVNLLTLEQNLAVLVSAKSNPFPCGDNNAKAVYQEVLNTLTSGGKFDGVVERGQKIGLGNVRKTLVKECGSGCNAPHDMYLEIAVKVLFPETPACVE